MKIAYAGLKIFSLSLVSVAGHAAIIDDCPLGNCKDKSIVVISSDDFNLATVNFSGNSQVMINEGGNINKNRLNFQANSEFVVNTSDGITGSANIWVMQGATATFQVTNAMNGGSYTSNGKGNGGILNLNATHAISSGKLLLDNDAVLNINSADAITGISGNEFRLKGNSVINLNHENSLLHASIKLEGDSRINVHANNALGFSNDINFAKTYDTKKGSVLELNGHSITIGSISGNDTSAKIINSGNENAFIYSGLTNYSVLAGDSYNYMDLLKTGVIRSDAVISTALGDITRQAVLSMRPEFSDRVVPQPGGIVSNGYGVWLRALYRDNKNHGAGITNPKWKGYNTGMQFGFDIWPANEDAKNKLGLYFGWLHGKSNIMANSVYGKLDNVGSYDFTLYGAGVYNRYTANQGWYISTILQWSGYNGHAKQSQLSYKSKVKGRSVLVAEEIGYPLSIDESFMLLPTVGIDYQNLKTDDYKFINMRIHNNMDNLLQAYSAVKLYYNVMGFSGVQWSPFLEIKFNTQLAARDKTSVHVIDSGYQKTLLTTYAGSQTKLAGGITVKMSDHFHYYAKMEFSKELNYQSQNLWSGSVGGSFYW